MIFGPSHIVLGSVDPDADRRLFESMGWTVAFQESALPTHPSKRRFMVGDSDAQALVFCQPPGSGLAVELIRYRSALPAADSPLQLVLPRPPQGFAEGGDVGKDQWPPSLGEPPPVIAAPPGLTAPLWFAATDGTVGTLVHVVTDLPRALRFWCQGLGFAVDGVAPGWARLRFPGLRPAWRTRLLLIARAGRMVPPELDGAGYRCLSFLCSALHESRVRVLAAGGLGSTGAMEVSVGGRRLQLDIIAGPDGVLVELAQPVPSAPRPNRPQDQSDGHVGHQARYPH